ncbi:unnamed protein product [Ranitomeya imitator]|uniref:Uncharacterized protein n=1 Tax=Ranitomeya imitator TaxID=111125 RepID=A0ABN9L8M1_9NEOB|nr:unnamed protein product [Ranitomeya imitator]
MATSRLLHLAAWRRFLREHCYVPDDYLEGAEEVALALNTMRRTYHKIAAASFHPSSLAAPCPHKKSRSAGQLSS